MLRRFLASRDGTILVLVAMAMVIFLGFVALSFDLGRVASTQSELQSYADNVALAAAGELDGGDDALVRATNAAARIADSQTFGTGDRTLDDADYCIDFHTTLPADDATTMAACPVAAPNPADAIYARVLVNQHGVNTPIANAAAMLTGNDPLNAAVDAEAVAGYTAYACDITPMMFCVPPGFKADEHIGEMIRMRAGASWERGNFGFLNTSDIVNDQIAEQCQDLGPIQTTQCQLAAANNRTGCFAQRGVVSKPGQNQGNLSPALNVRFNEYEASVQDMSDELLFAPAPNTIQGRHIPNCSNGKMETTTDTMPLPWDSCFSTKNCPGNEDDIRFGDGVYDWNDYIDTNHGDGDGTATSDEYPEGTDATSTRYEMYLAEIEAAGDILNAILDRTETGRPDCRPASPDPERRTLILAGIDCDTYDPGPSTPVPVEEFVKVFLTHPVGLGPAGDDTATKFDVWGEVVGSAGGSDVGGTPEGIFHEVVQLYR